ncbi:MAG TPA: ATP-binding protein [Candidatus Eisenbacteria bacterium]|jgi:PAS domain S-box-containing protein|nr:ATP-binding protein [Candidatus Eisenbacteria bacterium]
MLARTPLGRFFGKKAPPPSPPELLEALDARRAAEESLRRSRENFYVIVQGVRDYAILMLDPMGMIITWNEGAQRIKGYAPDEILGKHFSVFYPEEAVQSKWPETELENAAKTGRFEDEGWRVRRDGTRFWANVVITTLYHPDGTVRGFLKITRDLTERMRSEEGLRHARAELEMRVNERTTELGEANRALKTEIAERHLLEQELRKRVAGMAEEDRRKNEFLATLAHELRNPLAPIQYAYELMNLAGNNESLRHEAQGILHRQVQHMVRLIDDLLDLSRITRNKLELRRDRVELATVLEDAVETVRPTLEARGHDFRVRLAPGPVPVHADRTRLAQVFSNLLNNAAKFTERGGRIRVTSERQDDHIVVHVRDDGIGIAPAMLPRIFDMFVQADRSLERTQSGLGIGLTLVKRVVEMHGGTVVAESEGLGQGSDFSVRLPLEPAAAARRGETDPEDGDMAPATSVRVLVADDNEDAVRSLAMMIRAMGHEVHTARDGAEVLEVAASVLPALILMDIGMPRMNGYDAARRIREQPWGRTVTLVALTGWGLEDDRRLATEAGFDRHVVKPVEAATLREILAGVIA